jgi:hypothetical protein
MIMDWLIIGAIAYLLGGFTAVAWTIVILFVLMLMEAY